MSVDEYVPLLLKVSKHPEQRQIGLSLFFAIICIVDVFGVFPVVALPRAVIQCGWLGIPIIIFLFFIQAFTAVLLGKCWLMAEYLDKSIVEKNRYPYAALAEMTYGKTIAKVVTVLLDVTIFGGSIPNIIVAAQNLEILGLKMSAENFHFSHCHWMLLLGLVLCPLLWMGSPKDMKILCFISVVIIFSTSLMIWLCIYCDVSTENNTPELINAESSFKNIINAYGIMAFQFDIHPSLLTIQVDMENKSKISSVVFCGFFITSVLFTLTTIFAASKYGLNTYINILQGLPSSYKLYFAVLLVTVQLCVTCAISNSALYQHIEDYLNIPRDFNYKRCLMRSGLTIFAVFVAESVPKFDLVMSLIGGTLTGPLIFIFPPLFYIKMIFLKRKYLADLSLQTANHFMYHYQTNLVDPNICNNKCLLQSNKTSLDEAEWKNIYFNKGNSNSFILKLLFITFIIVFGLFATCTTTYINFKDAIKYMSFSPPCLYNFTIFKM